MRSLKAANLTQTQADKLVPIVFVEVGFDEGIERYHSGIGDIVWGGDTWSGVGDLGGISPIEEAEGISPYAARLTLSGLTSGTITRALGSDIYGRDLEIFVGFLVDGALVADPDTMWKGQMDTIAISLGDDNTVGLTGESELKIFREVNGKLFNDESQQRDFAGDLGFEYLDQMADAQIIWRGSRVTFTTRITPREPREPRTEADKG